MDEQLIIDILYFIFHDVFQWLSYFTILTLMLTPRFNRAFIILVPVCCRIQSTCLSAS